MPPQAPTLWRSYVRNMLVGTLISGGEHERGLKLLEERLGELAGTAPVPLIEDVTGLLLMSAVRTGHYKDLESRYRHRLNYAAWPGIFQNIHLLQYGVFVARMAGDRSAEEAMLEDVIGRAERWGLRGQIAQAHAEGAFGAWLADDANALARHIAGVSRAVEIEGFRGFAFLLHALERRSDAAPWGGEELHILDYAHLVRSVELHDRKAAASHAQAALAAAQRASIAFLEVLARVILAAYEPEARGTHLLEARRIAAGIDEPAVAESIRRLRAGAADVGILTPLVRRLSSIAPRSQLRVSFLFGHVTKDGVTVKLRRREAELISAIAQHRHGVPIQRVCDLLWPDDAPEHARNAFRVTLARLRRAIGEANVISQSEDSVAIAPAISVDLWEIEDDLSAARRLTDPSQQALRLEPLHQRLRDWEPDSAPPWEWFAPVARRIAETDHEVTERLARSYLRQGRLADALVLANRMIERDPLDEPAHELRIRILLAQGEHASALRELRLYGTELRRELGIETPRSLTSLVTSEI